MSSRQFMRKEIVPIQLENCSLRNGYVDAETGFIAIVEAPDSNVCLSKFVADNLSVLEQEMLETGGLIFTGFSVPDAEAFHAAVLAFGQDTLPYMERAAVRKEIAEGVFTSTEFAATSWIDLHHEMSFSRCLPERIFFFAETIADKGGETPVADERATTKAISSDILEEFRRRGVLYIRNYRPEIDMDWRSAFQTDDREEVAQYCRENKIRFEWISQEHLRTEQPQIAFARDPYSGEELFCNHTHIFHHSAMPKALLEALRETYGLDGLPRNVLFGDGATIHDETVMHLRSVYDDGLRMFPWKQGDVMMLDNIRCLHGRAPFEGKRTTLVSMTGLLQRSVLT